MPYEDGIQYFRRVPIFMLFALSRLTVVQGATPDQPVTSGDNTCSCVGYTGCYTVRSGDTIFELARACGVALEDIQSINSRYSGSFDAVFPDDVVCVPAACSLCCNPNNASPDSNASMPSPASPATPTYTNPTPSQTDTAPSATVSPTSSTKGCPCKGNTGCYIVQSGDTFFQMARTCAVALGEIQSINPQYSGSFEAIFPGDEVSPACNCSFLTSP